MTFKQTLQKLPIVHAQVKAGNTSENVPHKIPQIIYSLYWAKEITKKVYNNMINLIQIQYKGDTIFMHSKNSKISDHHKLLVNISNKINLNRSDKYVALSNLYMENNKKIIQKKQNLKYQLERVIINLNYLIFCTGHQDYFEHIIKNYITMTDNPPIRLYVNKIEYRITFEIKTGYYLELNA